MEPKKVGRALGIGVRVASNMLRERVERAAAPSTAGPPFCPPAAATGNRPQVAPSGRPAGAGIAGKVAALKRAAKAFGQALWGPFTHAGSVLWLEITGLFFALFALFFGQSVYRVHGAWKQGAEHAHLLLYGGLAAAFAWFSISSFTRAYRKSKRGPSRLR